MKIVFLNRDSFGHDVDLSYFEELGEVVNYDYTLEEDIAARSADADVIVLSRININEKTLGDAKNLKLVCATSTGINNIDTEYLDSKGIGWRNVAGYSTESVAQHTFALLFYLREPLSFYDGYVAAGDYIGDSRYSHYSHTFHELSGQTWGIMGMGAIGKRVAEIASALGCKVIYYSTSGRNSVEDYERVDFDGLLSRSDILSVHAPLNKNTFEIMNYDAFKKMKKSAVFINVGRGQIVVEEDLARAIEDGEIAAAGIDVLTREPMEEDNPLRRIKDSSRLFITPHVAWAAVESRTRLMRMVYDNIVNYFGEDIKK